MDTFYAGLELATTFFVICVIDANGKVIFQRKGRSTDGVIKKAASEMRRQCEGKILLMIETGELTGLCYKLFGRVVDEIVVCNPRENKWISEDPNKSDELDAYKLADLRRMGRYKKVFIHDSEERRVFKTVVQHYEKQTREKTRCKNIIKSTLRINNIIRKDSRVFNRLDRKTVLDQIDNPYSRMCLEHLFSWLDNAEDLQLRALKTMKKMSELFPEVELLKTVPGVHTINACRFVAYVQDPARFPTAKALLAYSRLGIVQPTSDNKPIGPKRLNRAGCGTLKDISRKAYQASLLCKKDNIFKRAYRESYERTKNESHARLSVQRKVISVMRAVWMTGKPYRDDLGSATA